MWHFQESGVRALFLPSEAVFLPYLASPFFVLSFEMSGHLYRDEQVGG